MITPSPLQKGQKVAIVAPAKSIGENDIDRAVEIFEAWGLEVALGRPKAVDLKALAEVAVKKALSSIATAGSILNP